MNSVDRKMRATMKYIRNSCSEEEKAQGKTINRFDAIQLTGPVQAASLK